MTDEQARRRFAMARIARLATADAGGHPHIVPMVFAVASGRDAGADTVYSAVDAKPKRSTSLRRLANIAANPRVAVLVDRDEGGELAGGVPQGLLGVVDRGAREPDGSGHLAGGQHLVVRHARQHVAPGGDVAPELVEMLDRPPPEGVVVGGVPEVQAAALGHPAGELGDPGGADRLRGGLPEDGGGGELSAHIRTMPS